MKAPPLALALTLFLPAVTWAWPVDRALVLSVGEKRTETLAALDWLEVEGAGSSVLLATRSKGAGKGEREGEGASTVTLDARSPGETLVLLYAEGRFAVWSVKVPPASTSKAAGTVVSGSAEAVANVKAKALTLAKKACGRDLTLDGPHLTASVNSDACRLSLRALMETDAYAAKDLELTFSLPMLQAQLRDISKGLAAVAPSVVAQYAGAGLVLKGELDARQHRAVLWQVFRSSLGRVAMDDQLHVKDSERHDPL